MPPLALGEFALRGAVLWLLAVVRALWVPTTVLARRCSARRNDLSVAECVHIDPVSCLNDLLFHLRGRSSGPLVTTASAVLICISLSLLAAAGAWRMAAVLK